MASRGATRYVWLVVAVAVAVVVAQNGKMCMGIDMEGAKDTMVDKAGEAKDTASSWTGWAMNKLSGKWSVDTQGMKEGASDMMYKAGDKASEASGSVKGSVKGSVSAGGDMYDGAKQKVGQAYESAKDTMAPVTDKAKDTMAPVTDKAKAGYDAAKDTTSGAYASATGEAKAKYEAAKEKASDAAGAVGAKMRT